MLPKIVIGATNVKNAKRNVKNAKRNAMSVFVRFQQPRGFNSNSNLATNSARILLQTDFKL